MRTCACKVCCAQPGDLERILEVERECVEAPHWSKAIWGALLAEGVRRVCLVAEKGGVVAGFVVVGVAGNLAELESVVVRAEARRCGIGKGLCEAGMGWVRERGAASMELEVRASNTAALALYRELGFREQGRRRGYYREPVDDAVLLGVAL